MLTRDRAFKISYWSLGLAFLTIFGLPIGCNVTGKNNSGWEYLADDINFLSFSSVLFISFLLASLFSGAYAFKQHKLTALWVIPLGLAFVLGLGYSIFGLYIYVFDPYGMP